MDPREARLELVRRHLHVLGPFRPELWTSRVWPGAVLAGGEVVGTWRRTQGTVTVHPWQKLTRRSVEAIEAEVMSVPVDGPISVRWDE